MARETGSAKQVQVCRVRRARRAHLTVRLESEDKSLIEACAADMDQTVSEWIREIVKREAELYRERAIEVGAWTETRWSEA